MYINQNSLQYKQFKDFEKYARFICEKFDINVQLEATRAETDGKTIYLPHIMSLTPKELDMMYSILLHEAGHIRYSNFDESYFLSLKTQYHAFLANAIEDARIENLLMKDFGGAKDIFTKLYTEYTSDKKLMKKVFKHEGDKPDLFMTFAFYMHNEMVECDTSTLKEISGARTANSIIKFFNDYGIYDIIENEYPKNDKEVISLTNKVYDLFFNYFNKKDTSFAINYKQEIDTKNKIEKILDEIKNQAFKVEQSVKELKEQQSQVEHEISSFDIQNSGKINPLISEINELSQSHKNVVDKIEWKSEYNNVQKQLQDLPQSISKLQSDLQKQIEEKNSIIEKMNSGKNGRGKELTPEQIEALKAKLETKKRQEEKINSKIQQQQDMLSHNNPLNEQFQQEIQEHPEDCDPNADIEALSEQASSLQEQISKLQSEVNAINEQKKSLIQKKEQISEQIKKIQNKFAEQTAEKMFHLDSMGQNAYIDFDILPELNYQDSWPEASQTQQNFDEKASKESGKMVRNGQKGAGLFGSNVRDIITFIDKKKEIVEEIDVLEIFKGKIHTSKLEDLNNDIKQTNYMEDRSVVGIFGTRRELIPFTTEFDSIKKENTSKDIAGFNQIVSENAVFFRDLKRVFAKNFKFSKKDFWKGGKEEGNLDVRNLWKLPTRQGNDFFEISNPKFENKVAASILVDISGSQNKEATEYGKKLRSLVIGLSQALNEVHIKHEILGYHAPVCEEMRQLNASSIYARRSNKLETIVYKEVGQKDQMGVMNIEPQMSDNSDGESLRIAIKRLKTIRAKSHMIFIISDGKPFLCDTDMSVLDEDFKAALRLAVREKVQVFGLGFFNQLELFMGNRFCNTTNNENVLKFFQNFKV